MANLHTPERLPGESMEEYRQRQRSSRAQKYMGRLVYANSDNVTGKRLQGLNRNSKAIKRAAAESRKQRAIAMKAVKGVKNGQ